MNNWQKVRLKDVVSILGDGLHGTPKYDESGEYFFINGNNLSDGQIKIKSDTKRVNVSEYLKHKKDLNDRTLLVSINGTIGNVATYKGEKCILGKSACYFNILPGVYKEYIYYILLHDNFQSYAKNWATGTTIKNVSLKQMREYEFLLPSFEKQQQIAKILSSLDDKIELNAQINHNLEEQAKAIFKSWFVDFEPFQDERFVETEYGSIPKSWRLITLGEVTEEIRTKVKNKTTTVFSAIKTGELTPSEEYFTKQVYSKDISKYIEVAPLTFAYNPARVNIGSLGLNKFPYTGCVSPVYVVFKSESEYHHFFDFTFKRAFFREEVRVRASGSVRQSLSYADFSLIKIIYPPNDVVEKFNQIYGKISASIRHNQKEIQTLALLRDTLLPKLMSGELDISEVQV